MHGLKDLNWWGIGFMVFAFFWFIGALAHDVWLRHKDNQR